MALCWHLDMSKLWLVWKLNFRGLKTSYKEGNQGLRKWCGIMMKGIAFFPI